MAEIRRGPAGFVLGFAGDSFNTAVYCRRGLGVAPRVSYLTRIGQDPLSAGVVDLARAEGLDTRGFHIEPQRNIGIYSVQTDAAGERSFAYWRDQSAARMMFQSRADFDALAWADVIYLSGISLAILAADARSALLRHLAELRLAGKRIAFDSNYRPALWADAATARAVIGAMWRMTDIALPSVDDEMALFGDADAAQVLGRLRGFGCRDGALKCGAQGPVALDASALVADRFPPAENVVDTTAAGDSFNGGFLAARLQGRPLADCMMAGHQTARHVVGHPGAIVAQSGF